MIRTLFCVTVLSLLSPAISAMPTFQILIEADDGGTVNDDIFIGSFDSLSDLKTLNYASSSIIGTGQNIGGSGRSISGLTFDGSQYHMLIEADDGGTVNDNILIGSFNSLADLMTLNYASSSIIGTGQNIGGTGRSVRGLTFDGSHYHMLIEADDGGTVNDDIFIGSFGSLADLMTLNYASSSVIGTGQNIGGTGRSISGLTFDGSQYHVLIEADDGGTVNDDIFIGSFNSLADLMTLNYASSSIIGTGQNIGGTGRSIRGLSNFQSSVVTVPQPSTMALFSLGMSYVFVIARRNRRKA